MGDGEGFEVAFLGGGHLARHDGVEERGVGVDAAVGVECEGEVVWGDGVAARVVVDYSAVGGVVVVWVAGAVVEVDPEVAA